MSANCQVRGRILLPMSKTPPRPDRPGSRPLSCCRPPPWRIASTTTSAPAAPLSGARLLALADIPTAGASDLGGEVVGVEFERKGERWVYEFKVIDPAGRLWEVYVDAGTAAIMKREGH